MRLYFIAHQLAVVVHLARNGTMKLRRGAGTGRLILVGDAVDGPGKSIVINRRRTFSRPVRRGVAQNRIVSGIGRRPNLGRTLGAGALIGAETCFFLVLGRTRSNREKSCE